MTNPDYYSFQGQDRWVVASTGGQREGFFLDSGASDGLWGSNSRTLETDFGWSGICVEPNDDLFARLSATRSCVCLNCCLYDRAGEVDFLESADVFGGILDEYDPDHLAYARSFVASKNVAPSAVRKPARTIGSVLRDHGAPPVIDYWSLDTEGSELAILRSFPFDAYRVRFLTVEHNYTPVREMLAAFLARRGMQRVAELGIDDGYAWVGQPTGAAWRSNAWRR